MKNINTTMAKKPLLIENKKKIEEKFLDVYACSINVSPEEYKAVDEWTRRLFLKAEKCFTLKKGLNAMANVALTPPLVIEKQGDIKKSYQIYVIGVYVEEVIKREVFNA